MISVNSLIDNAFKRTSFVGDGETVSPTQAAAGLYELQSLISELNTEDFLLENYHTYDVDAAEKIKFAVKPDHWYVVDSLDDITQRINNNNYHMDDIYKLKTPNNGYEFYCLRSLAPGNISYFTTDDWNTYMRSMWPTVFVEEIPDRVMSVGRKIGMRYAQLIDSDKPTIDSGNKMSLSHLYTCETETEEVNYPHGDDPNYEPYYVEYFVIELDSIQTSQYRVTVLKGIKSLKLEDKLRIGSKYESMIEDGLCCKLCIRYKDFESLEKFEEEFEAAKRRIMQVNFGNRSMTYSNCTPKGYNDDFYNLAGGNFG